MAAYYCERAFWTQHTASPPLINEPLAAVSGVFFVAFGFLGHCGLEPSAQPMRLCMVRASMVFVGLGTCAYHTLTDEWLAGSFTNRTLYDGMTTALFVFFLFFLFVNDWMLRHKFAVALGAMTFIYLWIATNDSVLFAELDRRVANQFGAAVHWPTLVLVCLFIFVRVAWRFGRESVRTLHYPMWIALCVAVVSWLMDQFACSLTRSVFFCHALWHMSIAYVALYVTVLGMSMTYEDRFCLRPGCVWWPQLDVLVKSCEGEWKDMYSKFQLKVPANLA